MVASPAITDAERRWLRVLGTLNEYQARLFVAHRALELGRGGISQLSQLTGMSRPTIARGIAALRGRASLTPAAAGRIRRLGSGRRKVEVVEPAIGRHLRRIVETRAIAEEVTRLGYPMTPTTVARCLHDLGYSLQANVKTIEGRQHPDRDAQFRYINARVRLFQRTGDPVVSVDTKKKELIGVPSV
jgi:transposase